MTSRDLVIRSLNHDPIDRAPRELWPLPGLETTHADELAEIRLRFPSDLAAPDFKYPSGKRSKGKPYHPGRYTDAWGCTWQVDQRGAMGDVKESPLADPAAIAEYKPPFEVLDSNRFDKASQSCAASSRFMLAMTDIRPFERLQFLRGPDVARADLAAETKEIRSLLAMVHDFYCQELAHWAKTDVDGVAIFDGWGSSTGLLLPPDVWRDLFRPLYREYAKIVHAGDKFLFFYSDGNILEILGELIKLGVDAIHCPLHLMDIERLAKRFRDRVTFWCETDRQQMLPCGTVEQVRQSVLEIRRNLDFGSGGLIARCQWGPEAPFRNVVAYFEQWMAPLPAHA